MGESELTPETISRVIEEEIYHSRDWQLPPEQRITKNERPGYVVPEESDTYSPDISGPGAHIAQDKLFVAVLTAIAEGRTKDPAALAKAALAVWDIGFDRWYE